MVTQLTKKRLRLGDGAFGNHSDFGVLKLKELIIEHDYNPPTPPTPMSLQTSAACFS